MVWPIIWVVVGVIILLVPMLAGDTDILKGDGLSYLVLCALFWPFALAAGAFFGSIFLICWLFGQAYSYPTKMMAKFWDQRRQKKANR